MKTYLLDKNFLKQLDAENQREVYAKIVSLNIHEEPIESIEGRVTGGSISIDGSSSVRRSCNLTLVTQEVDINDIYWGFSNKFKLYIGVLNTINKKYDDIIWFPQGTFVINSFNSSYTTVDYNISISGQDKMCLLNGTIGGNIPMKVNFGIEKYTDEEGYEHSEQRSIHYMIREMIHSFGNEPLHNIVIRDLAESGLELLSYNGHGDIYIFRDVNGEYTNILFDGDVIRYTRDGALPIKVNELTYYSLAPNADNRLATWIKNNPEDDPNYAYQVVKCSYGESAGYRVCELVWPDAEGLVANPGDTITSVLDKIVKTFGDYEYFYDLDGHFVFQKKLTYINTSWNNMITHEEDETYIESEKIQSQYAYSFTDSELISSFRNTPKIDNIKNDYTVWGKKKGVSGVEIDIHTRYGIQSKPKKYTNFNGDTYWATAGDIEYKKRPNPNGLSEDWWAVDDWAEFYKLYTGHYPEGKIGTYCTSGKVNIDLNIMFGIAKEEDIKEYYGYGNVAEGTYGKWFEDWEAPNHQTYVFDVLPDGKGLGYLGHYGGCSHQYSYFLNLKNQNVTCYIYKPLLPTQELHSGLVVDWREIIYQMAQDYMTHNHDDDFEIVLARNNPEFERGITGYEQYYTDLLAFWRLIYDPKSEDEDNYFVGAALDPEEVEHYGWARAVITDPSSLIFWFDLLDPAGGHLQKYSISAIGSRPKVINDTKVKSIVYKEVPTLIYISQEQYNQLKLANSLVTGYTYVPMPESFQNYFKISTQGKSAQQVLDESLYECAFLNEKINLQGIPIYHLEPNVKVYVQDDKSGIQGDYIIEKIQIPLDYSGKMSIEATRAPIRLY